MRKKEQIADAFKRYVPEKFVGYVVDLLFQNKVHFKVTKPRKSKYGDFRPAHNGKPHRITVNGNLNPYAFLITTLHEFAHLHVHIEHGVKIKPHGEEWKNEFQKLLTPLLLSEALPEVLKNALSHSFKNIKATSCTDLSLYRVLKQFDEDNGQILLEELALNKKFQLGNKCFERGELRRKRFLCKEVYTGRKYLISRVAEVTPLKE